MKVLSKIIEIGARIDKSEKIYVADVEISDMSIARAAEVDRRVVKSTIKQILSSSEVSEIFSNTKPVGISYVEIAKSLGYEVFIIAADPFKTGVIASVTNVLAKHGIVVRQALADDPYLISEPRLTLVVEGKVPPNALNEIKSLSEVKILTVLK